MSKLYGNISRTTISNLYTTKLYLCQLNLPKIVQEFDEIEITTKVCGVLGRSVQQYNLVSFTDKEILGNFWTFINEALKEHFISGTVIDKEFLKIPPS